MALYPSVANAAGTVLRVSTTLPATHDAAGFQAIVDWTEVGYVTEMGGFPREVIEYGRAQTFNQGEFLYAQTPTIPEISPTVIFQDDDAGQDIIEANADGETKLAIEYVLPSGLHVAVVAYVSGYAPTATSPSEPVGATFTIAPLRPSTGAAVIRHTPA